MSKKKTYVLSKLPVCRPMGPPDGLNLHKLSAWVITVVLASMVATSGGCSQPQESIGGAQENLWYVAESPRWTTNVFRVCFAPLGGGPHDHCNDPANPGPLAVPSEFTPGERDDILAALRRDFGVDLQATFIDEGTCTPSSTSNLRFVAYTEGHAYGCSHYGMATPPAINWVALQRGGTSFPLYHEMMHRLRFAHDSEYQACLESPTCNEAGGLFNHLQFDSGDFAVRAALRYYYSEFAPTVEPFICMNCNHVNQSTLESTQAGWASSERRTGQFLYSPSGASVPVGLKVGHLNALNASVRMLLDGATVQVQALVPGGESGIYQEVSFNTPAGVTVGTHLIQFRVTDDEGGATTLDVPYYVGNYSSQEMIVRTPFPTRVVATTAYTPAYGEVIDVDGNVVSRSINGVNLGSSAVGANTPRVAATILPCRTAQNTPCFLPGLYRSLFVAVDGAGHQYSEQVTFVRTNHPDRMWAIGGLIMPDFGP
jgi:hypothetical protein